MSLGLKRGTVAVVPYDPQWSRLFQQEKQRIEQALGDNIQAIEHIGSTSVPGLAAKPIIDMIAAVDTLAACKDMIAPLEKLGYEYMPERVFADRVFLPKGPRDNRTHHLSLVVKDSDGWRHPIAFRNRLISHPDDRDVYQTKKQELAQLYPNDRASYTNAKEQIIQTILQKAAND